ncbi:hypothetical protein MKW92_026341 [Papaver armeniacum]|nr:hypothetical protein MKW92_026341 [Papaver armeniacum]
METSKEEEDLLSLLKKLQELEARHASLQELSNLTLHQHDVSSRPKLENSCKDRKNGMDMCFSDTQYLNILQSMGQAVYIYDFTGLIIYWNSAAENLFGYSASEALGQNGLDLVADGAVDDGIHIAQKIAAGEKWTGAFPVKNKQGKRFEVFGTGTPLYDDYGSIVGIISISSDSRGFLQLPSVLALEADSNFSQPTSGPTLKADHDSQQPQQVVVTLSGSCTLRLRGDVPQSPYSGSYKTVHLGEFYRDCGGEGKTGIHKIVTSRGESWISKKQISQPWKGHDGLVARNTHDNFGWMTNEQEDNSGQLKSSDSYEKPDIQLFGSNRFGNKAIGMWSSLQATNTRCVSSSINTGSNPLCKFDTERDSSHYDILWEELTICEQIGRGSSATVYHGLWCGSDVALKVFSKFEYSDDLLHSFRQEARGMNYLHNCEPPVVHRDLKSSNLLVDKNWTVKVGDFGLSRLKHATFLTTKKGKGTAQWMAPEVIGNDPSDEKSDVYSFGVILWELATGKIPWDTLNSMQVIGAVGFMDQRLEIPDDTDPQWASLIESCWHSEPKCRPSFQELLVKLKDLQKCYSTQPREACLDPGGSSFTTSGL